MTKLTDRSPAAAERRDAEKRTGVEQRRTDDRKFSVFHRFPKTLYILFSLSAYAYTSGYAIPAKAGENALPFARKQLYWKRKIAKHPGGDTEKAGVVHAPAGKRVLHIPESGENAEPEVAKHGVPGKKRAEKTADQESKRDAVAETVHVNVAASEQPKNHETSYFSGFLRGCLLVVLFAAFLQFLRSC